MNANEYTPEVAEAIDRNVGECIDKADRYEAAAKAVHQLRRDGHIDRELEQTLVNGAFAQKDFWLAEAEKYKAMRPAPKGFDD